MTSIDCPLCFVEEFKKNLLYKSSIQHKYNNADSEIKVESVGMAQYVSVFGEPQIPSVIGQCH